MVVFLSSLAVLTAVNVAARRLQRDDDVLHGLPPFPPSE